MQACCFTVYLSIDVYLAYAGNDARETALVLTSDNGRKTILVLVHSFLLLFRAKLRIILSISPLRYSRSEL